MKFVYDDGGREAAGFRGQSGDCVCRAIAIATEMPYREVYNLIVEAARFERPRGRYSRYAKSGRSTPRMGVTKWTVDYVMKNLGWRWTPMTGFLVDISVPDKGRIVVSISRHLMAVIDGTIHDVADPRTPGPVRQGHEPKKQTKIVYGYWSKPE